MSNTTHIQWTDITDNIFRVVGGGWFCKKISPGCKECYAAKINASSFFGGNGMPYSGAAPAMELQMDICHGWQRMTKPKKHFVCSMTDVFGEWLDPDDVKFFLNAMTLSPMQTFQLLTKRPETANAFIAMWLKEEKLTALPENIWFGFSAEDQQWLEYRWDRAKQVPCKIIFISAEPLLGPLDFSRIFHEAKELGITLWIILGGESGRGARESRSDWFYNAICQCLSANVKVFMKQFGAKARWASGEPMELKDSKGGEPSEWPEFFQRREFPV